MMSKSQKELEPIYELTLPGAAGEPVATYPGEVIDPLRRMLTHLGKKNALPRRIAMVAALRGEGVTYLSQALAATMANDMTARICVIDLNWWWPAQKDFFQDENGGLAAVLAGEKSLDGVLVPSGWPNLFFIPAGQTAPEQRHSVARSQALRDVVDSLDASFDHLIFDIPAILATSDAVTLASLAAHCCLVIRQGVTPGEDVRRALDEIDHLSILGVVMNQVQFKTPRSILKLIPQS
jgi:Mrp family chromosome partitioning ATPase